MFRTIKILFSLVITLSGQMKVVSQNNAIYRSWYLHQLILNPAISGSEYLPVANLSYQKQWIGIPQSPQTMMASASIRIGNFDFYNPKQRINRSKIKTRERIGLGMAVYSDKNGPAFQRGFNLAYAFHLELKNARLAFGISGSGRQNIMDETFFQSTFPDDPLIGNQKESLFEYNTNAGVYYYSAGLFAGVAANNLIPFENRWQQGETFQPDIILHGGYLFHSFGRPQMETSFSVRYLDLEQIEYDINFRFYIQRSHWLAVSAKSYQALAIHTGIKIREFYIVYSYEANLSKIIQYNAGTHGMHIGINLGNRRIKGF